LPLSKYGKNVGLNADLVGNEIVVNISRYTAAGAGNQGFLSAQEAYELACRYDDCTGTRGAVRVNSGCLNAGLTAIDTTRAGRDCYVTMVSTSLTRTAAATSVANSASMAQAAATVTETQCANGATNLAIGATATRPCTDFDPTMPAGLTYQVICRNGGTLEINPDPATNLCTYTGCTAQSFPDRNGNSVSFSLTPIGAWYQGRCPANMAGYTDAGVYDTTFVFAGVGTASFSSSPALRCLPPGGADGWNQVNLGQVMAGYCDTVCNWGQLSGNGTYGGPFTITSSANPPAGGNPAYLVYDGGIGAAENATYRTQRLTPVGGRISLKCAPGYSDTTSTESNGVATPPNTVAGSESQELTCQTAAGAGYTTATLNCQSDCNITTTPGWNAATMQLVGATGGAGSNFLRRGTSATIQCAGSSPYAPQSAPISCDASGAIVGQPPCCSAPVLAASLAASAPTGVSTGSTLTVSCAAGYGGNGGPAPGTTMTCTASAWSGAAPLCYQMCGGTYHNASGSCSPSCSCGVASNGSRTCSNGVWGGCTGGSCNACAPPPVTCWCTGNYGCAGCGGGMMGCDSACSDGWTGRYCDPGNLTCSDRRLKQDIHWAGIQGGVNIYRFRYIGSSEVYEGVMAQEVIGTGAAVMMQNGFMAVDYGRLGIPFRRVD
jgi:hypothetical protein